MQGEGGINPADYSAEVNSKANHPSPEQYQPQEGADRINAETYLTNKTENPEEQAAIAERALAYGEKSEQIGQELYDSYDQLGVSFEGIVSGEMTPEQVKEAFTQKLTEKISSQLEGQATKQQNAEIFIQFVTDRATDVALANSESLSPEEVAEQLENALRLANMATEAIALQDLAANAVSLGDHGWHHLYQDMRDSLILAEGLQDDENGLSSNHALLLSLTAAFHDIGYSSEVVTSPQQESSANYGLDKGHPLLSYTFLKKNPELFLKVLSAEDYEALCTMVINHENPERAHMAGPEYEHLSKAFAHADAAASVGIEKVPPIIAQEPGILRYAYLLNQASAAHEAGYITEQQLQDLIEKSRQDVISSLESGEYDADQAQQLLNVFTDTHLTSKSLKFILGRLTGEMGDVQVVQSENNKKVALTMKLGEAPAIENYLPGAIEAGAKLAIKVFGEQAGVSFDDDQRKRLMALLLESQEGEIVEIEDLGVVAARQNDTVLLESPSVQLNYSPEARADQQREFYDKILASLDQAQQELVGATMNKSTPENQPAEQVANSQQTTIRESATV